MRMYGRGGKIAIGLTASLRIGWNREPRKAARTMHRVVLFLRRTVIVKAGVGEFRGGMAGKAVSGVSG